MIDITSKYAEKTVMKSLNELDNAIVHLKLAIEDIERHLRHLTTREIEDGLDSELEETIDELTEIMESMKDLKEEFEAIL